MKTSLRIFGMMFCLAGSVVAQETKNPEPAKNAQPAPVVETAKSPDGVDAAYWISIAPNFGFVVTRDAPKPGVIRDPVSGKEIPVVPREAPVVGGYFMVQQGNRWLRVEVDLPAAKFFRAR